MKLKDFVNMYVWNVNDVNEEDREVFPNCYVLDQRYLSEEIQFNDIREITLFCGILCDIPGELLQKDFDKWDMVGNWIYFILK